jgi:hypothetical protein
VSNTSHCKENCGFSAINGNSEKAMSPTLPQISRSLLSKALHSCWQYHCVKFHQLFDFESKLSASMSFLVTIKVCVSEESSFSHGSYFGVKAVAIKVVGVKVVKAVAIEMSSMDVGSLVAVKGMPPILILLSIKKNGICHVEIDPHQPICVPDSVATGGMTDGMESAISRLTNIGRFAFRIPSQPVV